MSLYIGNNKVTPTLKVTEANIEEITIVPSTTAQVITPGFEVNGYAPINVEAVTASIDPNLVPENIKEGIVVLGIRGTYTGS